MAPEINVKPGSKILVKGVGGVVATKVVEDLRFILHIRRFCLIWWRIRRE